MIALFIALIPLLAAIYEEYLSAQARAREADKKFSLDQATLTVLIDSAVMKWAKQGADSSKGMSDAWDQADQKPQEKLT